MATKVNSKSDGATPATAIRRARSAKEAKTAEVTIELPQLNIQEVLIPIRGLSPLISHRWSQKARDAMLDKQMKRATQGKEAKNPQQDYEESLYPFPGGGYGFPAVAFKNAAVSAVTQISGITKVFSRGAFHVNLGEHLVEIHGEPRMREDMVRLAMGVADIRYRAEFPEWTAELRISYNATAISPEQIANLVNTAGFAVGVGEWRPERDGSYGMFAVVTG